MEQDINHVISELSVCTAGSLKGMILEPLALRLLSISEASFAVKQMSKRSGGLQLGDFLSFAPMSVRADENTTDAFIEAIDRGLSSQGNILLVPRAGFAVVDAVAIVGVGEARCCLFLQVTVAVKHPVTGDVAAEVLAKLIGAAGGADKCALVYVLPNNGTFSLFRAQTVPECGKSIRQYKISLKTESGDEPAKKQRSDR